MSLNDRTWIATPEDEVGWRDGGLQRELGMYGAVLQNGQPSGQLPWQHMDGMGASNSVGEGEDD